MLAQRRGTTHEEEQSDGDRSPFGTMFSNILPDMLSGIVRSYDRFAAPSDSRGGRLLLGCCGFFAVG